MRSRAGRLPSGLLGVQLAAAMVDFGALGLTSDTGFDRGKWLVLLPGLVFGLYLLVTSAVLMRWLLAGPMFVLTAWFGWALLGVGYSVDRQATFLQMTLALSLTVSAFWFVRTFGLGSFARIFAVAAGVVLAVGLANDLVPPVAAVLPIDISQTEFGIETGRSPGLTPGVNQLGMLAGLTILMLVRVEPRSISGSLVRFGLFGVAGLAMLTAGSRSVAVCSIAALAVQSGLHASPRVRRLGAHGATAAVLVTFGLIGVSGTETTFQAGRSFDSLNGRSDVWAYATELIVEHPVRGVGMMTGEVNWAQAFNLGRTSFDAGDAHNTVLELMVSTGSIGTALFVVALVWAGIRSWRQRNADALALILLVTFVGLTEALISAAGLIYSVLGVVMALVAVDPVLRPWPEGRGGNPETLLGDRSVFEPVGSLA